MDPIQSDPFRNRGAVEQNSPEQQSNLDFAGQIGHRNKGPLIDSQDSDFPEPGENPEHSGEVFMQDENVNQTENGDEFEVEEEVDQDPGERQKENQNDQEDDPLAA